MIRCALGALLAAFLVAATAPAAEAQMGEPVEDGASIFEAGAYGGASWSSDWLERADEDNVGIGAAPALGGYVHFFVTPAFGIRGHGAYIPANLGTREQRPGFFDSAEEGRVAARLYDLNLVFRPWVHGTRPGGLQSSAYIFVGGGGLTVSEAGAAEAEAEGCRAPYEAEDGACLPLAPRAATVGQGTVGVGVDLVSLIADLGIFAELAAHGYSSPFRTGEATPEGVSDPFAVTGRGVLGVKISLGRHAPAPGPRATFGRDPDVPQPPEETTGAEADERAIRVCVVEDGTLRGVDAVRQPETGDTLVVEMDEERPFHRVYPMDERYAAVHRWFAEQEPIVVMEQRYVPVGLTRRVEPGELTGVGAYQGVPVLAESGAEGAAPPESVFLPIRHGCEVQPYEAEDEVQGIRG